MNNSKSIISMKFFVSNLNLYMANKNLKTIKQLAKQLNLNHRRVESWLNFQRTPSISTLDTIANIMNVFTHDLISQNIDFSLIPYDKKISNNSPKMFCINFRKILNKYDIKTADEFFDYFDENISKHTYYSYFKNSNAKIPSLSTIESLAICFNLQPYKLIERIC